MLAACIAMVVGCGDPSQDPSAIAEGSAPNADALAAIATTPDAPPTQAAVDEAIAEVEISSTRVRIAGSPREPRTPVDGKPFTKRQGNEVGIPTLGLITPVEFSPPFINGRGIAAGDIDHDGFVDVLVATKKGIELYKNHGGVMFALQPIDIAAINDLSVFAAVLVDLNDDGWLDIVLTSYMQGNHVILSDHGDFTMAGWHRVEGSPDVLTTSIAFGDLDEDGDLDAYAGNWYYGAFHQVPPVDSTNQLLFWDEDQFVAQDFEGEILGETLATLLSDFNMDGHLDIIAGNDFGPPDAYHLGDGKGGFRPIYRTEEIIPASTESTMSIDTADFDNDLDLDIYVAQIAEGVPSYRSQAALFEKRQRNEYCEELNNADDVARCREGAVQYNLFMTVFRDRVSDVEACQSIGNPDRRTECVSEMTLYSAILEEREELCDDIADSLPMVKRRCIAWFQPSVEGTPEQYLEAIPQIRERNVLLRANDYGRFDNVAVPMGVDVTGWSWNARFFDADNDEWQDIYVVNGTWLARRRSPQKFFFRNHAGERFEELTDEFGLQSFMVQSAFVTIDMDNDGDLDLLVNGVHGPFWYYHNNDAKNGSVLFALRDGEGNGYCVGCKVRIFYGPGGEKAQIREIKLGGGYHSFNPSIAHFGLGEHGAISAVEVEWSTGGTTRIEGPLPANVLYTVTREGVSAAPREPSPQG